MIRKIDHTKMGRSNLGWLNSHFHFSFAEYFNEKNINFGVLRVINDDLVQPSKGFDFHPHHDMEIISYVVDGQLTHQDSMGNKRTLSRGQVQYMSAGKGVMHSEYNFGKETLRFLQIWILPDKEGHTPNYGDHMFDWNERNNKWLKIASGTDSEFPIQIHQDVNIYALALDKDKTMTFDVDSDRQAYLVQIEGSSNINNEFLVERDALESIEENLEIKTLEDSHFLVIEMKKE